MVNSENILSVTTDLYKEKSQIKIVNQKLTKYLDKKSNYIFQVLQQEQIQDKDILQTAYILASLQKITLEAHCIKKIITNYNENLISQIQIKSPRIIQNLAESFNKLKELDLKVMGEEIISYSKYFKKVNHKKYIQFFNDFNEDKLFQDIIQKINNYQLEKQNFKVLKNRYNEVKENYDTVLSEYISNLSKFKKKEDILQKIKKIIKCNNLNLKNWNDKSKKATTQVLGLIFAAWSLLEISEDEVQRQDFTYKKPNPSQIIAILIILRCQIDQQNWDKLKNYFQNKSFDNQIIQILTGEGKSVIIGVLSAFLAFLGYNVHAVCYSKYLSQRDQQNFKHLHDFLEVDKYIIYDTFKEISELNLLQDINIRDATLKLVNPKYLRKNVQIDYDFKRPAILLIDEIDVFFQEDFYGQTYNPVAKLQSNEIKNIFYLIWEEGKPTSFEKKQRYTFEQLQQKIKKSKEYQQLLLKYQEWEQFMKSHIDEIINCMVNFSKQIHQIEYQVKNDKIGYKQTDHSLCFKTQYSYLTIFTYFYEHQKQNISKESLEQMISIDLKCGNLSYAESPNYYEYILGVTSTLETVHEDIKNQLTNYQIKSQTYIPSMFGPSNIQWDEQNPQYFSVEQNYDQWLNKIVTILANNTQTKQPVLIFFDSKQNLFKFYNNYSVQKLQNYFAFQILEESIQQEEKDQYIRKSTMKGFITFSTKSYGRGTNFKCNNDSLNANGGVKVIQTFLSQYQSEEVQIKGRIGSQGMPGQYHLIINFEQLQNEYESEWQNILQIKAQNTLYDYLDGIRNKKYSTIIANYSKYIKDCKNLHDQTLEYIHCLQKDTKKANNILQNLNKHQFFQFDKKNNEHIILVLDHSSSMKGLPWKGVCESINMFLYQKLKQPNTEDIVSIIIYQNNGQILFQYEDINNIFQTFNQKQTKLQWGGTNFASGLSQVFEVLKNQSKEHQNFKVKILFLSDGQDSSGDKRNEELDIIQNSFQDQITFFWTMGISPWVNSDTLIDMANRMKKCGGDYKTALTVNEMKNQFYKFAVLKQHQE